MSELWGAQRTVVEDRIAMGMGLVPVRYDAIVDVSQKPENCPVYRMSVMLGMRDFAGASGEALFVADIVGVASPTYAARHAGLLGRDFLANVRFVYDGPKGEYVIIDNRGANPDPPRR